MERGGPILGIETSGRLGSIAAGVDGALLDEEPLSQTARHAADLLPAIDRLWRRQGWPAGRVDACCVSVGPGSFTGLRVAVTVARHLALARGARLVAVPTLDVIADAARPHVPDGGHVAALLDAKGGRVFAAYYRRDDAAMSRLCEPKLAPADAVLQSAPRPCWLTGEGLAYHEAAVAASGLPLVEESARWPRARSVLLLGGRAIERGEFVAPFDLVPMYIRPPEAAEVWARRHS